MCVGLQQSRAEQINKLTFVTLFLVGVLFTSGRAVGISCSGESFDTNKRMGRLGRNGGECCSTHDDDSSTKHTLFTHFTFHHSFSLCQRVDTKSYCSHSSLSVCSNNHLAVVPFTYL